MVLFEVVQVPVTGTGTFDAFVQFPPQIASAQVCLRGLTLLGYTDGSPWHYRGATVVQINSVSVGVDHVHFKFNFDFSEGTAYQMGGSVEFLVIASTQ